MNAIVGTQMYTWQQWFAEQGKPLNDNLDEALAMIADAGLAAVEHSIGNEADAEALGRALAKHKLKLPSAYTGGVLHTPDWRQTADSVLRRAKLAHQIGAERLSLNPAPLPRAAGKFKSDDDLRRQAEALSYIAVGLRDFGMTLAYHSHDPEMQAAAREFHHMAIGTRDAGGRLCLDCHWVFRGAADSNVALQDVLALYGDRLAVLHLRQSKAGVWTEHLADGDLDYAPVAAKLKATAFDGPLYVESAFEKGTPRTMSIVESHRKSRAWVKDVFGV